ncbi:MAG TPA: RDD family protein [Oculatellaceae cyanobacterium]
MPSPQYSISTPENVDLHLELAGLGNRILACVIDTFVSLLLNTAITIGLLLLWFALKQMSVPSGMQAAVSTYLLMLGITANFLVIFGYYLFFEGLWHGQTPGKRIVQIRVIEQNGQPITWSSAIVRNLIRIADQSILLMGLLCMFLDKNERRIGDFAAGTMVIRERTPEVSTIKITGESDGNNAPPQLDVGRITPDEYDLLTTFLKRREKIKDARESVANQLTSYFKQKLGEEDYPGTAESFLESIYSAYRSRAD